MEKRTAPTDTTSSTPSFARRMLALLATLREAWAQRLTARWRRVARPLGVGVTLLLFLLSATLTSFAQGGTAWYTPVVHAAAATPPGKNTFQQTTDLGKRVITLPQTKGHTETAAQAAAKPTPITRPSAITMQPAMIGLSASVTATAANPQPITWTSSDKRLTVTIPAGAVTPALVTQGNGGVWLQVTQFAGPSGGMGPGSSGKVSLGTYSFTLYGRHTLIQAALARPITLTLHLNGWLGAAFDLGHVLFVQEDVLPASAASTPANAKLRATLAHTKPQVYRTTLDGKVGVLLVPIPLSSTGSSTGTWNTNSPQAHWDAQADTGVDLSGGDLTYSYPLDVPSGPGGLTPKLTLSYDSSSVANEHNPQATAGWLGEGWDLSMGSISWGEHNVTSYCTQATCNPTNCPNYSCALWENSWQFSDPYGNGGELIPQDSNISIWHDDTTNTPPGVLSTEPISWNLSNEGHVRVISFLRTSAYFPEKIPCFRAFLPNGYMEEFGCTDNAIEYYVDSSQVSGYDKGNFISKWDLDLIVDPNGNQIHITYNGYEANDKLNGAVVFPVDNPISTITYDSPSCHSTTTMCTGSN